MAKIFLSLSALIAKRLKMTAVTLVSVLLIAALTVGCTFSGAMESLKEPDEPGAPPLSEQLTGLGGEENQSGLSSTLSTFQTPQIISAVDMAQTVYTAITGEQDFYAEVNDQGETTRVFIAAETYDKAYYGLFFDTFQWKSVFTSTIPADHSVTLTSADGANYLRAWADSDVVLLHQDGKDIWVSAAPNDEGATVYLFLTDILESALNSPVSNVSPVDENQTVDPALYGTRITAQEIVLQNGVRLRMTYDEVVSITGYQGEAPSADADSFSFTWEHILYGFTQQDTGEFILTYINITEDAADASIFRGIGIGDSIESVFSKIPARDTELKKWAFQTLYGSGIYDEAGYAELEFVAMSYYFMKIITPESTIGIVFSRNEICVKWIEIYDRPTYG